MDEMTSVGKYQTLKDTKVIDSSKKCKTNDKRLVKFNPNNIFPERVNFPLTSDLSVCFVNRHIMPVLPALMNRCLHGFLAGFEDMLYYFLMASSFINDRYLSISLFFR